MEQEVCAPAQQGVKWAVWLNAESVRAVNPEYDRPSQWCRESDHTVALFDTPEAALDWVEDWIKEKWHIRFYEAREKND